MKLLILITTYNRNNKVINTLKKFNQYQLKSRFSNNVFLTILDDNPDSILSQEINLEKKNSIFNNFYYIKNKINLGQGYNLIINLKNNLEFDYYWCPGDDDIILFDKLDEVIQILIDQNPTNMCLEFRQGKKLEKGTFFEYSGLIEDIELASNLICKFGKGSSTLFSKPSTEVLDLVHNKLLGSMYEDKGLSLLIYLFSNNRKLIVYNKVLSIGDDNFGTLRYSFRVFANLKKVFNECVNIYNIKSKQNLIINYNYRSHNVTQLWIKGILNTILIREIRYTLKRFLKELFVVPVIKIFDKNKFEKNY